MKKTFPGNLKSMILHSLEHCHTLIISIEVEQTRALDTVKTTGPPQLQN